MLKIDRRRSKGSHFAQDHSIPSSARQSPPPALVSYLFNRSSASSPSHQITTSKRVEVNELTIPHRIPISLPTAAVVPYIARAKHAIQQPPSNPVRPVLPSRPTAIEQGPRKGTGVPPDLHDSPALVVWADMVPEERGAGVGVCAEVVEEERGVLVHVVVNYNSLVLGAG